MNKRLGARNFGAAEKILKERIQSVTSVAKITKAMKMVSASKMKGDLARLEGGRHFAENSVDMIFKTDLYMQRKTPNESADPKTLLVPITSDKGLCGGVNSSVVRDMRDYIADAPTRESNSIFVIGDKGTAACIRPFPDLLKESCQAISHPISYATTMSLCGKIIELSKECEKVVVFYNYFKNSLIQENTRVELMSQKRFYECMKFQHLYEMKRPDERTSRPALYELYLSSNVYNAQLNNAASEQAARMNAMENASKNAGEIIDKLSLEYNKARQASITMELVEIISGASAV
jgi:F-type H+-transporting ATPase subunit gamma